VFSNHLVTYVQHLPRSEWRSCHRPAPWPAHAFMDWTTNPLVALYFAVRERNSMIAANPQQRVYVLISNPPHYSDFKRNQQPVIKPVGDTFTQTAKDDTGYSDFGIEGTDTNESSEPAMAELQPT